MVEDTGYYQLNYIIFAIRYPLFATHTLKGPDLSCFGGAYSWIRLSVCLSSAFDLLLTHHVVVSVYEDCSYIRNLLTGDDNSN